MDFKQLGLSLLVRLIGDVAEQALLIAIDGAKTIANDPALVTNAKKRAALLKKIKAGCKASNITLKDSVINLLAELAVSVVKRKKD